MKKTFKGYSALIALLIALLVVTAMPMMAFANEPTDADPDAQAAQPETMEIIVGTEKHEVYLPGEVTKDPTCGEAGEMTYRCTLRDKCGSGGKHVVEIDPTGEHEIEVEFVEGDCETGGKVITKCKVCKKVIKEETTSSAHQWNPNERQTYDLMKNDNGDMVWDVNGDKYINFPVQEFTWYVPTGEDIYDKDGNWIDWIVTGYDDPTPKQVEARETTWREQIYANEKAVFTVLPTCQKEGEMHFECMVCGAKSKTYKVEKNPNRHTYSPWEDKVGKEATCTKAGLQTRHCTEKGHGNQAPIFDRIAPATGHNYKFVSINEIAKNACYPSKVNVQCSNCKDKKVWTYDEAEQYGIDLSKISKHTFEEKKDHFVDSAWINGKEVKSKNAKFDKDGKPIADICTEPSVFIYKCKNWNTDNKHNNDSSAYKVVNVAAKGHKLTAWKAVTPASDKNDWKGHYTRKCENCTYVENKVGKLVDGKVVDPDTGKETEAVQLELDLAAVKDGEGIAEVSVVEGEAPEELYARVAWFYETNDGLTYGFTAIKNVDVDDDGNMTVDVSGPNPGVGFNFTGVQVVITTDKNAHKTAEYADSALAMAKA